MKENIEKALIKAVVALQASKKLPPDLVYSPQIERARDKQFGDYASNLAMMLTKAAGCPPRELAQQLIAAIEPAPWLAKVEIAGPGFINFTIAQNVMQDVLGRILQAPAEFGHSKAGSAKKVLIEYVSANPTGPLHVGHGRGAAFGASLAELMRVAGYNIESEYYVNDAGRQMNILATSLWLRYCQANGVDLVFPSNGYRGDYMLPIAEKLVKERGDSLVKSADEIFQGIPDDEPQGGDKEAHIDALIERAKQLLAADYDAVHNLVLTEILNDIRDDLAEFGVHFDRWYSEKSLMGSGAIDKALAALTAAGHTYEKEGALWFKAESFGDEKDRVLVRKNGQTTYFASDVAYHYDKYQRGYTDVIDIFGADHHGYLSRLTASIKAMGKNADQFQVKLVQFATLYRGEERVQMSTRSGSFVTLRELREEVGNDAARFFYVLRKPEQHMDFDLELAKSQTSDNPVYYIQYAYARICSVFRQMPEKQLQYDQALGLAHVDLLVNEHEKDLLSQLNRYPELIDVAARNGEPHHIAHYCRDLANAFHTYYNAHAFLVEDADLRNARLCLIQSTAAVLKNALAILGVSAPESM